MIELPPLLLLPEPPAIIRPLEGGLYGTLDGQMQRLGLPRGVRRSIMAEMAKVVGGKPGLLRATAAEMARYSKDPSLASMLLNPFTFAAAPPAGPTVTFIGTFTDATTTDPHTFTANVGPAGPKIVIVCPHSLRNAAAQRTIVSVSIDGTNGTLAAQNGINDGVNEGTQTGIAYREISTGGVITIIDDWSAAHSFSAADVYTITGYTSNVHDDIKTATGNNPTISTLTVAALGCVIASASGVEPATGAFTFSGVSLDNEQQCDSASGIVHMREGCGHATGLSATSTYNVQATSSAGFEVIAAISFH
ncbi:hypothetical protein X739_00465 [Mesorhizobium sp. LNHC220B00]|nr:hypothetical protein [Mesorhizobium sp. LNHC220B00]ESY89015.1 hypothetical protein X739_00465 [Mesorhizobium sp. LNHC220B00]